MSPKTPLLTALSQANMGTQLVCVGSLETEEQTLHRRGTNLGPDSEFKVLLSNYVQNPKKESTPCSNMQLAADMIGKMTGDRIINTLHEHGTPCKKYDKHTDTDLLFDDQNHGTGSYKSDQDNKENANVQKRIADQALDNKYEKLDLTDKRQKISERMKELDVKK